MGDLEQARADVDALTAALLEQIDQAWDRISRGEQRLVRDWLGLSSSEQRRRILELQHLASTLMDQVERHARAEIADVLRSAFRAGAVRTAAIIGAPAEVSGADADLLKSISDDTWLDVLNATQHVRQSTKEMTRALGQQAADLRFSGLTTAEDAGKQLAQAMVGQGISAIVYRDGSRHGLDDYANMLLRTKTAEIQQVGGFRQARRLDIRFMELLDNPSCGLSFHDDPTLANGLVLPLAEAEKYPISHPRCVRVSVARPDLLTPQDARDAAPSTTGAQNADQRVVEQARQSAAARRAAARTLESRTARAQTGLLTPSAGAARSPAARRAASRTSRIERRTAKATERASVTAARELLATATAAEPRLTELVTGLAEQHGGTPAGLDFRLKGLDSLTRKIDADVAAGKGPADRIAGQLFDVNRYTTVFPEARYATSAQETLDALREQGYTTNVKNYWNVEHNPYQGINVQVTGPTGERFELQFHTPTSLDVKEGELHTIYERARVETDPTKLEQYTADSFTAAARIPVPPGVVRVS